MKLHKCTILLFLSIITSACISAPKQGEYSNITYENIIKKYGSPTYENIVIIDNNFSRSEIEPVYSLYFSEEELKNTVKIKKILWDKSFNKRIIVWLKLLNEQWVIFDSLEYNSKYIHF